MSEAARPFLGAIVLHLEWKVRVFFYFFFLITSFLYFGRAASSLLRRLSPVVTSCDAQASHYGGFSCAEHGL